MGACPELVPNTDKIYQPRNPKATKLYQLISSNLDKFLEIYPERFGKKYGPLRNEVVETLESYLRCGLPCFGFARVKCSSCNHEFILPFSCKTRRLCPSCSQRQLQQFSLFLTEHILEKVPHRHMVFSLPKIIRRCFLFRRKLLKKLTHCAWATITEFFQETIGRDDITPGMAMDIQTYGGLLQWSPHIHGICTDGGFDSQGTFYPLPRISNQRLGEIFTAKVLAMLIKEKAISRETSDMILSWRHSGFSVYTDTLIQTDDENGLTNLAEYIVRSPFSDKKLVLADDNHKVVYHDKLNPGLGRNFQVFDPLEFLATLTIHIPAKYKHTVLYFGWYSQAAMGKRKKDGKLTAGKPIFFRQVEDDNKTIKYRWAQLIKKVYADPLICSRCGGKMKIIAFISDKNVIKKILTHLKLWEEPSPNIHSPPKTINIQELTYEPIFDDLPYDEQLKLFQKMN